MLGILPVQCLLAKEVALAQHSDELLLLRIGLANRHAHLTLRNDEERVAACALPHNVVALLVERLLQHVGDLDQRVLGQFFEDRYTEQRNIKYIQKNNQRYK